MDASAFEFLKPREYVHDKSEDSAIVRLQFPALNILEYYVVALSYCKHLAA